MRSIPSIKVEAANVSDQLLACRICLATDTKLFNIFDNGLDTMFLELLGIAVSREDGCPRHVCVWCGRLRARRSDALLRHALREEHHITNSVIHNINRAANDITLHLTQTNTEIIECEYTEPIIKHKVEIQVNDTNDDETIIKFEDKHIEAESDSGSVEYKETEVKKLRTSKRKKNASENESEKVAKKTNNDETIIKFEDNHIEAESDSGSVEYKETEVKKLQTSKRKKKASESESEKVAKKTKKIRRMFECEEDFPKFESKYNMEIVVLTMEQQLESMAARKNSSNYMNSPFKCELCFKGFSSEATFKNHNLKHHDPSVGSQVCRLCHSRFRIPGFLRTHEEIHRLKFVCRDCRFVASNRSHAISHSREHSGVKYVCKHCGASFKKPSTHGTHVRIQHPTQNSSCDVCGETFQSELGLRLHKTRAHKQSSENESEYLNCRTCGVHFASSYAMARHTYKTKDNVCNPKKRACTLCGENLATEELLLAHTEERHSRQETKCDECNKTFLTEASRSVHYERVHLQVKNVRRKAAHHATKQYGGAVMCELCGKKCKNSTILKYHRRTHTGEKPHTCPRCPKRFVSPAQLDCHLRSHTGERPYKCSHCHKSFLQKSALNAHKTVHTGEKPFACPICEKSFTQSASVHTHVKYVHMKMPAPPRRRNMKREHSASERDRSI